MKIIREFPTSGPPSDVLPEIIQIPTKTHLLYCNLIGNRLVLYGACEDIALDHCEMRNVRINFYNVYRAMPDNPGMYLGEIDLGPTFIPCFVYVKEVT